MTPSRKKKSRAKKPKAKRKKDGKISKRELTRMIYERDATVESRTTPGEKEYGGVGE